MVQPGYQSCRKFYRSAGKSDRNVCLFDRLIGLTVQECYLLRYKLE